MRLWLRQLAWTLRVLFSRRRIWLGFAAFALFDLLVLGLLQVENLQAAARGFYLKSARSSAIDVFSGLTLAHFILRQSVTLLGSLYLALVAGEAVAGEVDEGTMRSALCRPVSRLRLLVLRWIACAFYTVALVVFLAAMALACGLLDAGPGHLLILFPGERTPVIYAFDGGLIRFGFAVAFLALNLLTITALGFMLSCAPLRPQVAAVATLAIFFADKFLHDAPFFRALRPWFFTTRIDEWISVYRPEIPWPALARNSGVLLALDALFLLVAWALFRRRDLKP